MAIRLEVRGPQAPDRTQPFWSAMVEILRLEREGERPSLPPEDLFRELLVSRTGKKVNGRENVLAGGTITAYCLVRSAKVSLLNFTCNWNTLQPGDRQWRDEDLEVIDELVRDNERMLTDGFYAESFQAYVGIAAGGLAGYRKRFSATRMYGRGDCAGTGGAERR